MIAFATILTGAICVEFCAKYDQNCFDPAYDTLPLEFFEPMVQRLFATPRRSIYLRDGVEKESATS